MRTWTSAWRASAPWEASPCASARTAEHTVGERSRSLQRRNACQSGMLRMLRAWRCLLTRMLVFAETTSVDIIVWLWTM